MKPLHETTPVEIVEGWREADPEERARFGSNVVRLLLEPEPSPQWMRRFRESPVATELRMSLDRVSLRARDLANASERGGVAVVGVTLSGFDPDAQKVVDAFNAKRERLRVVITVPYDEDAPDPVAQIDATLTRLKSLLRDLNAATMD